MRHSFTTLLWGFGKYFIQFRPLLHSPKRISEGELEAYYAYYDRILHLGDRLAELEAAGHSVASMELELEMALDKMREGMVRMVEVYIEGVEEAIAKIEGN